MLLNAVKSEKSAYIAKIDITDTSGETMGELGTVRKFQSVWKVSHRARSRSYKNRESEIFAGFRDIFKC